MSKLCYSCMSRIDDGTLKCPVCGFSLDEYQSKIHQLRPSSLLNNRYLVGKVIGEGGFGITYVGFDIKLDIKVAIKEYFPHGMVMRDVTSEQGNTVSAFDGTNKDMYEKYLSRFYAEAKALAKLKSIDGIVNVQDYFTENDTAYIIMEYVDGRDLKKYAADEGGKLSPSAALKLLKPVAVSLKQLHANGIIHRDISPDNIMVDSKGKVILIDLGASREFGDLQKSMSILLKPGYAPLEQYNSSEKQGPYTDIYAFCATLYRIITGTRPVDVVERVSKDMLKKPSELGIDIDSNVEAAIMKGMAVNPENRFQSMDELIPAFYEGKRTGKKKKGIIIGTVVTLAAAAAIMIPIVVVNSGEKKYAASAPIEIAVEKNIDGLKELDLSYMDIANLNFLNEVNTDDIESLNLSGNRNLATIEGIEKCKNLKSVNLNNVGHLDFSPLAKCKNLSSLSLLGDEGINEFASITELKNIEFLDLSESDINDLSFLDYFTNLKKLEIDSCGNLKSLPGEAVLKQLEVLYVGKCPAANELEKGIELPCIKELSVRENTFADPGFITNYKDTLKSLNANNTNIKIDDILKLTKLSALNYCDSAENLKELEKCTWLKSLVIGNVDTNYENVDDLQNLDYSKITGLEKLFVGLSYPEDGTNPLYFKGLSGTKNLKSLNVATINSYVLSDLSVIKNNKDLEELKIGMVSSDSNISVIGEFPDLKELGITQSSEDKNPLDLSFLENNKKLKILKLDIEDSTPLAKLDMLWPELENLKIYVKGIKYPSLDFLMGMTKLEELSLVNSGEISNTDISPLSNLTGLRTITLEKIVGSNTDMSCLSDMYNIESLEIIGEPKVLYNQVQSLNNLNFLAGKNKFKRLKLENTDILDVTGLSNVPNMLSISLSNCNISGDIDVLGSLKNLNNLYISGSNIIDGSFLNELNNLSMFSINDSVIINLKDFGSNGVYSIYLTGTNVDNPGFLGSVNKNVEWVDISKSNITDISFLKDCKNLRGFIASEMEHNPDLTPLKDIPGIAAFEISGVKDSDVAVLKDKEKLQRVIITNSENLTDVSFLSGKKDMVKLEISSSGVSDISAAVDCTSLKELTLKNSKIADISSFGNLSSLSYLNMEGNPVSDISVLKNCKQLDRLILKGTQVEDISALREINVCGSLDLSDSNVDDISPLEKYNKISDLYLNNTKISSVKSLMNTDIDFLQIQFNDIPNLFEELKDFKSDKMLIYVSSGMLSNEQIDELQKQHKNWSISVLDF